MLTLTDRAVTAIHSLTDRQDVPEAAGVRIAADPAAGGGLTLSLAPQPHEGDQVLDTAGARLFMDSEAAQVLDDKALDAAVADDGSVRFAVAEQTG